MLTLSLWPLNARRRLLLPATRVSHRLDSLRFPRVVSDWVDSSRLEWEPRQASLTLAHGGSHHHVDLTTPHLQQHVHFNPLSRNLLVTPVCDSCLQILLPTASHPHLSRLTHRYSNPTCPSGPLRSCIESPAIIGCHTHSQSPVVTRRILGGASFL